MKSTERKREKLLPQSAERFFIVDISRTESGDHGRARVSAWDTELMQTRPPPKKRILLFYLSYWLFFLEQFIKGETCIAFRYPILGTKSIEFISSIHLHLIL